MCQWVQKCERYDSYRGISDYIQSISERYLTDMVESDEYGDDTVLIWYRYGADMVLIYISIGNYTIFHRKLHPNRGTGSGGGGEWWSDARAEWVEG